MRNALVVVLALAASASVAGPKEDASAAFRAGDYTRAMELILPLAEAGDVDQLGNVGNMYAFGQGVEQDYAKAYSFWKRAADKHLGTAMGNIANLYMTGLGPVEKNELEAFRWYKRAAEHRHWQSMMNVSSFYALGRTVDKSYAAAMAWAALAASNAPSEEAKRRSEEQARSIISQASPEELESGKVLAEELRLLINENVKLYKNQ